MSENNHKYFFGQMPEMPWKRMVTIDLEAKMEQVVDGLVEGKEYGIDFAAYRQGDLITGGDFFGTYAGRNEDGTVSFVNAWATLNVRPTAILRISS